MRTPILLGRAVSVCAAALLAACGGSQPPIDAPGAMPQSRPITHTKESGYRELLYASQSFGSESTQVFVFSYPQGVLVQTLTGLADAPQLICSDRNGDVFVPTTNFLSPGHIYEFAHGDTQPVETLTDPGPGVARSCSVDPTTENLAVSNEKSVAVYPGAQGTPTVYDAPDVGAWDCAYDDSGDLFVDGVYSGDKIAELPSGGTSFTDIDLSKATGTGPLQWWKNRLVMYSGLYESLKGPYEIFQVHISGSSGVVSGPVLLYGESKHRNGAAAGFTLSSGTTIMPEGGGDSLL